jgi:hypothetical protein
MTQGAVWQALIVLMPVLNAMLARVVRWQSEEESNYSAYPPGAPNGPPSGQACTGESPPRGRLQWVSILFGALLKPAGG